MPNLIPTGGGQTTVVAKLDISDSEHFFSGLGLTQCSLSFVLRKIRIDGVPRVSRANPLAWAGKIIPAKHSQPRARSESVAVPDVLQVSDGDIEYRLQ